MGEMQKRNLDENEDEMGEKKPYKKPRAESSIHFSERNMSDRLIYTMWHVVPLVHVLD
jgi:hypothetical protein